MAEDKVYFRADAEWLEDLENELAAFPGGPHDDQVDALSYGAQELVMGEVEVPPDPNEPYRRASRRLGPFHGPAPYGGIPRTPPLWGQ